MKTLKTFAVILSLLVVAGCQNLVIEDKEADVKASAGAPQKKIEDSLAIKKKILVLKILNKSRHGGEDLALIAQNRIKEYLMVYQNEFTFVPPEEIEGIDALYDSLGEYIIPKIYKKARDMGMSGFILGTISDVIIRESNDEVGFFRTKVFSTIANFKMQIFDVTTEKEMVTRVASADVTEEHLDYYKNKNPTLYDSERGKVALFKAMDKVLSLIPEYAHKLAWTGRIAKIEAHRIFITAGEHSGIPRGQILKVFGEGHPIYDPESNRLLGISPGRFKGLLKVIQHFGEDGSIAVVHAGGGFKEKDRVEIFTSIAH